MRWLEARAWVSAESHRALFDRSIDHLIASKVLLPGASVLWRLVGTVCHRAAQRGYELIARGVTADERRGLERALRVREGSSETQLEWLRHGPVNPTAEGMVLSLGWLRELRVLSPALTGVDELPAARLRALLVDARTARAQQIAQMGDDRRVATLTAFAAIGELRAQDQTLDHLDVILSEIDDRAAARERKRRLEIAGLIDQAGVRLADACALVPPGPNANTRSLQYAHAPRRHQGHRHRHSAARLWAVRPCWRDRRVAADRGRARAPTANLRPHRGACGADRGFTIGGGDPRRHEDREWLRPPRNAVRRPHRTARDRRTPSPKSLGLRRPTQLTPRVRDISGWGRVVSHASTTYASGRIVCPTSMM